MNPLSKKYVHILLLGLCGLLLNLTLALGADIVIDEAGQRAIPLAHTALVAESRIAADMAQTFDGVLGGDLDLSGLFAPVDPASFLDDARRVTPTSSQVNFAQWRLLGAQMVIKGSYELTADGLILKMRLYDVINRRLLLGQNYQGRVADARRMAHRFADQVLKSITGKEGAFDTRIAYISNRGGHKELYLAESDGYDARRITDHRSLVLNPDFSPQGRELIFTSYRAGNPDLYRKEIYTGKEARISRQEGLNIAGRYNPGNSEIALTLSRDGNAELYLIGLDGRLHKRLTNSWGIDVDPSWSPLGDKVAFVSSRQGNPHIFVVDVLSGVVSRLTSAGKYNATPAWSPDGKWIVFSRLEEGFFNLYRIRPDGTGERQLTFGAGNKEHPRWSPDGRFILYSNDHSGPKRLYVMRADGSGARELSLPAGSCSHPAWSMRW
ncbi:MAG: Tol-Pal system beta propeller repeat protein TolB [Desulfuromonadaceae bacterium]|nr:Tol-Pal system beta propeller repeat protein TolB [Desulfuromonadaceae bacterium]